MEGEGRGMEWLRMRTVVYCIVIERDVRGGMCGWMCEVGG